MCECVGANSIVVCIQVKGKLNKGGVTFKTRGEWQWKNVDKYL